MEKEDFQKYLKERYEDQINWYDKKSAWNQKLYRYFQWSIIILAAITPVLVEIAPETNRWPAVIIAALVGIGSGIFLAHKRWQVLEGAELAIYWLGCAVGFVLLSTIFFYAMNLSWFGPSYTGWESGLFFGALVALGSGIYLRSLWKTKRPAPPQKVDGSA